MALDGDISWKEVAQLYRDLLKQSIAEVRALRSAVADQAQREADERDKPKEEGLLGVEFCHVCGDLVAIHDRVMFEQCVAAMQMTPKNEVVYDLTKDNEERKWDHGLDVYNRMKGRDPEEDTPVVYSFGPDDNDFEETTYAALKERYGELDPTPDG